MLPHISGSEVEKSLNKYLRFGERLLKYSVIGLILDFRNSYRFQSLCV
jgi:hypothetical protein